MRIGLVEDDPRDRESLAAVLRACRAASAGARGEGACAPAVERTSYAEPSSWENSPAEEGQRDRDSISCFSDAGEFFAFWEPGSFDVLFLDCYLPGADTGMDIARRVRAAGDGAPIAFVTSSVDFAVEGYDVGAVGYVVKPPRVDAVASALDRAMAQLQVGGGAAGGADGAAEASLRGMAPKHIIEARGVGGAPVEIDLRALRWCTTSGHYLDIALERADGSLHVMRVRMRFKDLLEVASGIPSLYSCMRGCLVDLTFVVRLEGHDFILRDGTRMPISRQNIVRARDAFAEQTFSLMRGGVDGGRHAC